MKTSSPSGFTLLELLISVAAVAILAALAGPALGRLRQGGDRVACISNLRTIGALIQTYAADHQGRFPVSRLQYTADANGNRRTVAFLPDLLNRLYVQEEDVTRLWWCPADRERPANMRKHSYGHNQRLGGDFGAMTTWDGEPNPTYDPRYAMFQAVEKPLSEVIMLVEYVDESDPKWSSAVVASRWPLPLTADPLARPVARIDFERHGGTANALMLDGSVRGFQKQELLRTRNKYILPEAEN